MTTYVIFDRDSGEVIHTHTEASIQGDPLPQPEEELLTMCQGAFVDTLGARSLDSLGVLEVSQEVLRQELGMDQKVHVDLDSRTLRTRQA